MKHLSKMRTESLINLQFIALDENDFELANEIETELQRRSESI
jgi:hypothetical protein